MQKNENGRSMVEMLGVLAIIGVLSVTGIYGYTIAMRRHRANEIVQTASMLAVMARAMDGGTGECVNLASTDLPKRPGGVNVDIVADATVGGDPDVSINLIDGDEALCDTITDMSTYHCGVNSVVSCP